MITASIGDQMLAHDDQTLQSSDIQLFNNCHSVSKLYNLVIKFHLSINVFKFELSMIKSHIQPELQYFNSFLCIN